MLRMNVCATRRQSGPRQQRSHLSLKAGGIGTKATRLAHPIGGFAGARSYGEALAQGSGLSKGAVLDRLGAARQDPT